MNEIETMFSTRVKPWHGLGKFSPLSFMQEMGLEDCSYSANTEKQENFKTSSINVPQSYRKKSLENIVNSGKPVYLTKNGYGAMVVLSLEEYANLTDDIEMKLDEADRQAAMTDERLSHETVFRNVRSAIQNKPYRSKKKRDYPYYRIYVRNYVVYYVVIDNIMEIRRLIYGSRDIDNIL